VSEGIPGFAILAAFAIFAWLAARRAAAQGQRTAPYLASALVAGLIAGLFVCFTLPGVLCFYATVAMLTGLAIPQRTSVDAPPLHFAARVPALALSLAAVAMFLYFTVRLTVADFALERARRDLDAGRIEDSIKAYQWSQQWRLAGSSDDLYFSRALLAASRSASSPALALLESEQAFGAAWRAPRTTEEPQNAWYNLAAFYASQNDAADAETCLRRSIAASPSWFKSHWALAQVLQHSGRWTEAQAEADRAADLDGGKDPEIAKFLQSVHHRSASPDAE
jgi:tetratricopeptide (TPR) repeat protein